MTYNLINDLEKFSYSYLSDEEIYDMWKGQIPLGAKVKPFSYNSDHGVVDAIDIDWKGIYVGNQEVKSSAHLAYLINTYSRSVISGDVSGTIPVLDDEMLSSLESVPSKYVAVTTADEPYKTVDTSLNTNGNYEYTAKGGLYLDIIFKTLRALQDEVTKLRNSFKYGIYSMTGKETAMSGTMNDLSYVEQQEPLWAIDPDSLTEIEGSEFYLDSANTLEKSYDSTVIEVGQDFLNISGTAYWNDGYKVSEDAEPNDYLKDCPDSKEFVYVTVSELQESSEVKFDLVNLNDSTDIQEVSFNLLENNNQISKAVSEKYNILLCTGRSFYNESTYAYLGYNFSWISVGDYTSGENSGNGFYKDGFLYDSEQEANYGDSRYYIGKIYFTDLRLSRLKFYSKYQDFSHDVQPQVPSDEKYKYKAAHLTIRSVDSYEELLYIKDQLPDNELVYDDATGYLYIMKGNVPKRISGSSTEIDTDEGMTQEEIVAWLKENGIITTTDGSSPVKLNSIGSITFINEHTGDKYSVELDSEGSLKCTKVNDDTLAERIGNSGMPAVLESGTADTSEYNMRGFVGTLGEYEGGFKTSGSTSSVQSNIGLYSDRIKIAAVYAPASGQTVYGCSHAFVELENTSDKDFALDGCYLHYAVKTAADDDTTCSEYSLALSGIIPAGGTYLIRGKQYSDYDQANTFIKVKEFDIEWYDSDNNLIDFTLGAQNTWLLTYGLPGKDIDSSSSFDFSVQMTNTSDTLVSGKTIITYHPNYIDSFSVGACITSGLNGAQALTWQSEYAGMACSVISGKDAIYKNMFELDPAQQAYQGLAVTTDLKKVYDSSRARNSKATDFQTLTLDKPVISFPKSDNAYDISLFTPKASYEHKNVCTDKSKLDTEHPNMVTCSFGINMNTTRCFNWVSAGYFDEYIWIRKSGETAWTRFESYTEVSEAAVQSDTYPRRKEFSADTNNIIYARMQGTFPGAGVQYTAHKCIIDVVETAVSASETWEYVVGRADINGDPDESYISEIYTFTLNPESYIPVIYQTTDQQGFHWVEYQVWAAAAKSLNDKINLDVLNSSANPITPVLVNTGDMTQNGTRINEWLDYYNAGKPLFKHLEQMNVVGNNDLCGTDPEVLGTGDDIGKSNGYYFHVFYCYEVSEDTDDSGNYKYLPIVNGKYVPSIYWFGNSTYTFLMLNSEITYVNCRDWFKALSSETVQHPVNIYTGWSMGIKGETSYTPVYSSDFITVYTMIYNILSAKIGFGSDGNPNSGENVIVMCHEMPFTVITNENITKPDSFTDSTSQNQDRSLSGTKLVGSHMNRMISYDTKSLYWLSRLCEYFNIKLMLGGHKHTYMCTNSLREFYEYTVDGVVKNSKDDGKMNMESTLENDTANFSLMGTVTSGVTSGSNTVDVLAYDTAGTVPFNSSKFPLMIMGDDLADSTVEGIIISTSVFYPCYHVAEAVNGVQYFMCQATGFKLKSNKELPSPEQRFSLVIPKSVITSSSAKPDKNQQQPMFSIISFVDRSLKLIRIKNITDGTSLLGQNSFSEDDIVYDYFTTGTSIYGEWLSGEEGTLINF